MNITIEHPGHSQKAEIRPQPVNYFRLTEATGCQGKGAERVPSVDSLFSPRSTLTEREKAENSHHSRYDILYEMFLGQSVYLPCEVELRATQYL